MTPAVRKNCSLAGRNFEADFSLKWKPSAVICDFKRQREKETIAVIIITFPQTESLAKFKFYTIVHHENGFIPAFIIIIADRDNNNSTGHQAAP